MHWILIVLLSGGSHNTPSLLSAPFATKPACQHAAADIKNSTQSLTGFLLGGINPFSAQFFCEPSGE